MRELGRYRCGKGAQNRTEQHQIASSASRLRVLILLAALALAGCAAPVYQVPRGGVVWGYRATSGSVEGLALVAYTPSKEACAVERAKDVYNIPQHNAWADAALGECQPFSIAPGTQYWAFSFSSYPGYGLAFSTPGFCEMSRRSWKGPTPSTCGPITLQILSDRR